MWATVLRPTLRGKEPEPSADSGTGPFRIGLSEATLLE